MASNTHSASNHPQLACGADDCDNLRTAFEAYCEKHRCKCGFPKVQGRFKKCFREAEKTAGYQVDSDEDYSDDEYVYCEVHQGEVCTTCHDAEVVNAYGKCASCPVNVHPDYDDVREARGRDEDSFDENDDGDEEDEDDGDNDHHEEAGDYDYGHATDDEEY